MRKTVFKVGLLLVVCLMLVTERMFAAPANQTVAETCDLDDAQEPILIITSYNPDTRTMADNLSAFLDEYRRRGCVNPISVETMNCKNLSEAPEWKGRMGHILDKYATPDHRPALIILLGQEAWGAFLSQTSELAQTTPSLCGLASDYTIMMPTDSTDLATWRPLCHDVRNDFPHFNIVGGYLYHYDIEANLNLLRRLYPARKHYLFLSDNTFGGLVMQSYVRQEMELLLRNDESVDWLDGRQRSITDVTSALRLQDNQSAVLIGTWRIDCTENYVMGNITHLLSEANPALPAVSVSSVGVNDWALGGFSPVYQVVGQKLADLAIDHLSRGKKVHEEKITLLPSHYVFDHKRLEAFHIDRTLLPKNCTLINEPPSFLKEHRMLVIVVTCIILFLGLCIVVALYYLVRINRMNVQLEQMSSDLIIARDKAEESNRLKSKFLANMSHEIRTPLNAIVGFSGVLTSEDVSPEERKQFADIIRVNSDMLLHLINDILDMSRIESGRMQFVREKVDVLDLCKMSLSTSEFAGRRTQAAFVFESSLARLSLMTDSQRLQQVLINLLSNAAKFTKDGFITLRVRVDRTVGVAIFTVEDTGCGIPADKVDRIFERFEKLDEYAQGTGLGLAICKLIVEKMGGRIWLDSSYTEGARFVFTHPLDDESVVIEEE